MKMSNKLPDIRQTVVLKATIEKVWKAVATAEGMAAWWMPGTFEPVLGHEFVVHAGPFGDAPCKVTAIEPPYRLSFDWTADWQVTFELKELDGGGTEFTLIHSGWEEDKVTAFGQPFPVVHGIMSGGWEKIVQIGLRNYVDQ